MLLRRRWTITQPPWLGLKKNKSGKSKEGKEKTSNAADKLSDDELENLTMLTFTTPDNPSTLCCTSDFRYEAHSASYNNGIILDCGASNHFTPERSKLLNYEEINPEPVWAADGHTFSAIGKGDLKVLLPNGNEKPTPVTLRNVYYSPNLAFTLMPVGVMDKNGYDLRIKSKMHHTKSKIQHRRPNPTYTWTLPCHQFINSHPVDFSECCCKSNVNQWTTSQNGTHKLWGLTKKWSKITWSLV